MGKPKKRFSRRKTHLTGVFTRSKLQSNLHFNRSGLSRPCSCSHFGTSNPGSGFSIERCRKRKNGMRSIDKRRYVDEWSLTVVKHLRKRRVFSLLWNGRPLGIHGRKNEISVDESVAGRDDAGEEFLSTKDINREQLFEERNMEIDCDEQKTSTGSNLVFMTENERDHDVVLFDLCKKEDQLLEETENIQLAERRKTMDIGSRSISKDGSESLCDEVLCDSWNPGVKQEILVEEKENTHLAESQDVMKDTNNLAPREESMQATPPDIGIFDFRHDKERNDEGHLVQESSQWRSRGSPENNLADEFSEQSQVRIDLNASNDEIAAIKAIDAMNPGGNINGAHPSHNMCGAEDDENMIIFREMDDVNNKPDDGIKCAQDVGPRENRETTIKLVSQNVNRIQNESNTANDTKTSSSRPNKLGINSPSVVNLLKTSGSFNYRRLLPYLVAVDETNLGVSENGCSINRTQLLEKSNIEFCREASPGEICAGGKQAHDDGDSRTLVLSFPSEGILSDEDCQLQAAAGTIFPSSTSMRALPRIPLSPDPETEAIKTIRVVGNWEDSNPLDISYDLCDTKRTAMVYDTVECGIVCKESSQIKSILDMKVPVSGNQMPAPILQNERSIQKKSKHAHGECASSSHKSKYVLDPCSRMKLLRTPGSISYRRLLPYLVDGSKTSLGAPPNQYYQKIRKQLEENLKSRLFSDFSQPLVGRNIIKESSRGEQCKDNLYLSSSDLVQEQDCQSRADGGGTCSTSMGESSQWCTTPCSPASLPTFFGNENGVRRCVKPMVKQARPSTLANGSVKGILKVNPTSCRGLCTCLSCVSLRQHAERELDITKSQMQEANHVAFDLINELCHLRDMLEKSISVSDDCHLLCMSQVKEACRKAYEVEESAKIRIDQLKHDVEKHCSMKHHSRRRVRFADYVEERVIL